MILQIPLSAAGVSFVMRRSILIKRKSVFVYSPSPYAAEDTLIEIFASLLLLCPHLTKLHICSKIYMFFITLNGEDNYDL